jgi:predicted oxidoreductase
VDFVSASSLRELVSGMNKLPDVAPSDYATVGMFLGGCIFSGCAAGRGAADDIA